MDEKLLALIGPRRSDDQKEYYTALCKAQASFPTIPKDGKMEYGDSKGNKRLHKYATLDAIIKAVTPVLSTNNLSIDGDFIPWGPDLYIITRITHTTSGQFKTSIYPMKRDLRPQSEGSLQTYYARYTLRVMLNIATEEDDDGHAAQDEHASKANDPRDHIDQRPASSRPPQAQRPPTNSQSPKPTPPPQRPPAAPQSKPAPSRPAPASPNPGPTYQPPMQEPAPHVPPAPIDSGPDPDDEVTIPATDQIHALKFHGGPFAGSSIRDAWMLRVKAITYANEIIARIKNDLHANVMENLFLDHGIRNNYIKENM